MVLKYLLEIKEEVQNNYPQMHIIVGGDFNSFILSP
jgi:hypothetical protein